jgi:hypothetical protein
VGVKGFLTTEDAESTEFKSREGKRQRERRREIPLFADFARNDVGGGVSILRTWGAEVLRPYLGTVRKGTDTLVGGG